MLMGLAASGRTPTGHESNVCCLQTVSTEVSFGASVFTQFVDWYTWHAGVLAQTPGGTVQVVSNAAAAREREANK